jgi:RND family efflux transporter MFP subunit
VAGRSGGVPIANRRYSRLKICATKICATFSLILLALNAPAAEPLAHTGLTEPVFDVALSLPVAGIITSLKFKEGDFVRTNEVIVELDNHLEEIEVDRRKCIMENHKADFESTRTVFEKSSSVSRDELLKKEADYKVSLAEYEEAREQLHRRSLVAPGSGTITSIKLHQGEACAPYEPVVRLVDTRKCYFVSNVEPGDPARLKTGQKVLIEIENPGAPVKVTGELVFVSPVVDSASGLQKIKAVFDNTDGKIHPGLAGKIFLGETPP